MTTQTALDADTPALIAFFEDLHAHPELGFQESRTSGKVVAALQAAGVEEIHTGIGGTGVVALIRGQGAGNRSIGIRADMDALPIEEASDLPYASQNPGVMHACGHDGHTTMLLGAAQHLVRTRDFDGPAVLIFQPAEEGLGGARRMIEDGLFDRFPCDEIYGIHNNPQMAPGDVAVCKGPAMAGAVFVDIRVTGHGSHAAMPQHARDALVAASGLGGQIQSILGRNVPPLETCVVSVTQIHAGTAYNVVPETATLSGTIRYFSNDVRDLVEARMDALCRGTEAAFGVSVALDFRPTFNVLVNDPALSDAYLAAAADIVGADQVTDQVPPMTGSEDFADMLEIVPGAYCTVGHTGAIPVHNPAFVLGPEILPTGAAILARIVETRLPQRG